jgi:hypothetical protein
MKHLLSHFVAILAAVGTTAVASAATVVCGTASYPTFPTTYPSTSFTCPAAGTINSIRSLTRVLAADEPATPAFRYSYDMNMVVGPSSFASPRAEAVLLKSNGTSVVSNAGTLCPGGVDNTVGNGAGNIQTCRVARNLAASMKLVRVFHQRL